MKAILTAAAVLACLLAPAVQADLYKWTDREGRLHYSDKPPPDGTSGRVKIRINSISGPASVTVAAPSQARKDGVRIYTTAWCGYCKRAKSYLTQRGVSFDEVDVEASASGQREFAALGGRGVPVILVGNRRMNGFDQSALETLLTQAGY